MADKDKSNNPITAHSWTITSQTSFLSESIDLTSYSFQHQEHYKYNPHKKMNIIHNNEYLTHKSAEQHHQDN